MKLLIDQNISHRIIPLITQESWDLFHVKDLGLRNADDHEIFRYARQNEFAAVITNDDDFVKLLNLFSSPPKIIWLRTGNCSTEYLAEILSERTVSINEFLESRDFTLYEVLKRTI
ncbi:DUF5615 family PIN-like protein [Dyadobacter luticola]|uniref:DUF5615 domain-containing protein n=1 Tax=Dyadobacter luticola TaxID=1979387 RepID=A0A5R9KXP9_9BACT|nr:DUF5615 family PIN-like protein [Dyadobacter luticola]TLV01066.1 hypothetical protein FEN17_16545 [Dyadobacter luticola]